MSYEIVIGKSKRIESILQRRFGASGRGLHEKIDSVAHRLSPVVIRGLRVVATVRNKLLHEDNFDKIPDDFAALCDDLVSRLEGSASTTSTSGLFVIAVKHLPYGMDGDALRHTCRDLDIYPSDLAIGWDIFTGRCGCFGFLVFDDASESDAAIKALNAFSIEDEQLVAFFVGNVAAESLWH
jgi:hypothetical protein